MTFWRKKKVPCDAFTLSKPEISTKVWLTIFLINNGWQKLRSLSMHLWWLVSLVLSVDEQEQRLWIESFSSGKKKEQSNRVIDQARMGGNRHPRREFMKLSVFGQFRGADSKNRCYTEKFGPLQPLFHVKTSFWGKMTWSIRYSKAYEFGQFRGADFKNRHYTDNFGPVQPPFHVKTSFSGEMTLSIRYSKAYEFGQFQGSDAKNQRYTDKFALCEPLFHAKASFSRKTYLR